MEIKITVERRRSSVTQGMADVLINGVKVMDFGDTIETLRGYFALLLSIVTECGARAFVFALYKAL